MKGELFFFNGYLIKEDPIMPFDVRNRSFSAILSEDRRSSPMKLVFFGVTDVDHAHGYKSQSSSMVSWSQILIPFQGNYTESKKNGGERVLCLLGTL
jgi:hypothetical protein